LTTGKEFTSEKSRSEAGPMEGRRREEKEGVLRGRGEKIKKMKVNPLVNYSALVKRSKNTVKMFLR
jgi:hypothetical protein